MAALTSSSDLPRNVLVSTVTETHAQIRADMQHPVVISDHTSRQQSEEVRPLTNDDTKTNKKQGQPDSVAG